MRNILIKCAFLYALFCHDVSLINNLTQRYQMLDQVNSNRAVILKNRTFWKLSE